MKFSYFLIVFLVSLSPVGAQTMLEGRVIDKNTGLGIPFAHVALENTSSGAITDLYGKFVFSFPDGIQGRNLTVSCVGYKTVRLSPADWSGQPILIRLELDIVELKEVVVTPEDPVKLIEEAVRRIPENYDTTATMLSGYYKVSSLLEEKNINYTEAFIDIFKPSYHAYVENSKTPGDSIRIRYARTKPKEINDWKLDIMLPWEKSIYQLEYRDVVKDFSTKDKSFRKFMSNYDFELENLVVIDGRNTYMIKLLPRKHKKEAYWNGYIYLDQETKAFVKWDIESTPKIFRQLKADLGYIILSKLYKLHYQKGEWKESIRYRRIGDKWHFSDVNSSKQFLVSSKKRNLENAPVNVTLHYRMDSVKSNAVISDSIDFLPHGWGWQTGDHINKRYDSAFWRGFDRRHGIASDDNVYQVEGTDSTRAVYKISRLDTLQGALTPLRSCFDVTFYHLDVEILPAEEIIQGSNLIRFEVVEPTSRIQVDLFSEMIIEQITWRDQVLSFTREYNAVYVDFPYPLKKGEVEEIKVFYSGRPVDVDPRIPMYAAFLWAEDENANPWFQAICQGYGASGWWPNKDHLSDEPDSAALSYTIPSDLGLIANGRLRSKTTLPGNRTRYEWAVSYPINNYNVTLNAGDYKHIHDTYVNSGDTLDLDYYVLPYHLENAKQRLSIVKPMLHTFEKYFGKYPFYRDGFKLVESPHAMEHQSCVAIDAGYFDDPEPPSFSEGNINFSIVLHESAHEWWGNNVSCTDNAELWLHESFARYAEALYIEDHYGYDASQQYLNQMKKTVANKNPVIGPGDINYIHHGDMDMYEKGALMLNTLRHVIGNDSTWFALLKGIQEEFRFQTIDTDDLVKYVSQRAGTGYGPFFDQYLRHPAIPVLELAIETTDGMSYVRYRWVTAVPNFTMPVRCMLRNGEWVLLHPTTEWQKKEYFMASIGPIDVDTNRYYIDFRVRE